MGILLCMAITFASPAHAYRVKVSLPGSGLPGCPNNEGAVIKVEVTDATVASVDALFDTSVKGDSGFSTDESVSSSSMYLVCNGQNVRMDHSAITFADDGNGTITFPKTTITAWNQDDIDLIVPTIDTQAVWCNLMIPESGGCTWDFPNAILLDRVRPDISGNKLRIKPVTAFPGGNAYLEWSYADTFTPGDPDGTNGNTCPGCSGAGCYTCNKTDTRSQWYLHRRTKPGTYATTNVGSTNGELTYITDTDTTTTKDRFISSPDTFCYTLRIQDTAGNWSVDSVDLPADATTLSKEKCIRTDGKSPQVVSVEYFTRYDDPMLPGGPNKQFFDEFPDNYLGQPVVTSNACRFATSTCDISANRYIEMKIIMNEPLFDGRTPYGYTKIRGDGFDNDNDGFIDEEPGGFDGVDNDFDGFIDEDVAFATTTYGLTSGDMKDNDGDGYVDEEPNGTDGKDNDGDGQTDEDYSIRYCDANLVFNRAQSVNGNDVCYEMPKIYIDGVDSEGVVSGSPIEWICTQEGTTTHPDCAGLDFGQTVYRYKWRVGRASGDVPPIGLESGEYTVTLSGTDGVGNVSTQVSPASGGSVWMDNTAPYISVRFYSDSAFTSTFITGDHDNLSATPDMSVADEGKVYIGFFSYEDEAMTAAEYLGATPTAYVFLPDAQSPAYLGTPQPGNVLTLNTYHACGQSPSCDYCTGTNCTKYDPDSNPCETFRTCFEVDSDTMNDGYAAVTLKYRDRQYNRKWHETDAQAMADQWDANPKASDDTGLDGLTGTLDLYEGDGIPTFVSIDSSDSSISTEQDIALNTTQYFAIDTTAPATPSIGLPITPCNGQVARANGFCTEGNAPVNNPTISWKTLNNGLNDDGNNGADEECIDGVDNDADGSTDEDAGILNPPCDGVGTQGWEIARWQLQVATSVDFATASIVKNTIVNGTNYNMTAMDERSASAPYYWRIAAFDFAGNEGPWNPQPPLATNSYFSFIVDVSPPEFSIEYYSDAGCSVPMATTSAGIPVTTDTESDPNTTVCLKITTDEPIPWATKPTSLPAITTWQSSVQVASTSSVPIASSTTSFMSIFEVDAKGTGKIYNDGAVEVKVTTRDVYGNSVTNGAPTSGTMFYVDSAAPECNFNPITPDPASLDNNDDGILGEPTVDGVSISFICNKYLGDQINVRVIQNNFNSLPIIDDGLDNDCDGRIDEESSSSSDDDGDGQVGEDTGSSGEVEGSGCYIDMFATGTENTYIGVYDVVGGGNYDGQADVYLGDTDSNSKYFLTDLIGSPVYADTYFSVDTTGPSTPVQSKPVQGKILSTTLPQFRWTVTRSSDLFMYRIELATSTGFVNIAGSADILDDGVSTAFTYDLTVGDITECLDLYPSPLDCPGLSDGTYYWRIYAIDLAGNKSNSSLKLNFDVDTLPPAFPIFNTVTTPTTKQSSPLSGSTSPAEKNAEVSIYVTGNSGVRKYIGTVTTDSTGKFTVGIDDDKDGSTDEETMNGLDDDGDSLIDEDPAGIFLSEGQNIVEGMVKDAGGNYGSIGCNPLTPAPFYDATSGKCIITLDSGAPKFDILYYSDSALTQPLQVINQTTNKQTAKAGVVYMKIRASEPLQGNPTFTVDQQGTSDVATTTAVPQDASNTIFLGTFTVNAMSDPAYLDGDATIYVKGTDLQGNTTADNTLPTSGGYLTIDTTNPDFRVTYWYDSDMREKLPKSTTLLPLAKTGSIFMRISVSEALLSVPLVSINHTGTADLAGATSTSLDSTSMLFRYEYEVNKADGSNYMDGSTTVTIDATDMAGNQATAISPIQGNSFVIDTTPPQPPTINLGGISETDLSQITVSGTVVDSLGIQEKYAKVEIFVRLDQDMTIDDEIDNDGDGRTDEEPNGMDGIDNDNDNFIDEDVTDASCNTGLIWDPIYSECITALDKTMYYDGLGTTDSAGSYTAVVTGLMYGVDYLFARATDMAGNVSVLSSGTPLSVKTAPTVTLTHTFGAGWNLVGVPLQPSLPTAQSAFRIGTTKTYQYKDGSYYYGAGQDLIAPGMCYWIYFDEETTITSSGVASTTNVVNLKKGWNLISIPYDQPVTWDSEIMVSDGSSTVDIASTEAKSLINPEIYTYDGNTEPVGYSVPIDPSGIYTLEAWEGFAIQALEDCQLIFPSLFSQN